MADKYIHGATESNDVTVAAQALSKARAAGERQEDGRIFRTLAQWDDLEKAEAAYKAAYQRYTNPFKVVKTFS